MWLAVCKRYRLIREFGIQVIHEKFLGMNYQITEFDYDAFFHHQADQFEELGNITDSTRKKLKQVIFLMIREAGLVNEDLVLGETLLSLQLKEVLKPDTPMSFLIFPTRSQAAKDDHYE